MFSRAKDRKVRNGRWTYSFTSAREYSNIHILLEWTCPNQKVVTASWEAQHEGTLVMTVLVGWDKRTLDQHIGVVSSVGKVFKLTMI